MSRVAAKQPQGLSAIAQIAWAASQPIATQGRLCLDEGLESGVRAVNGKLNAAGALSTSRSTSCHSPFHFGESPNSWMRL